MILFVISVVLAISAPAMRGYFASRQTGDLAANMLTLTRSARSTAISNGAICRINVDPQTGEYWLTVQQGGEFVPADGEMGKRFSPPEGTTVSLFRDAQQARTTGNASVQAGQSMGLTGPRRTLDGEAGKNYLQFYPTGRCDTGTIEIAGPQGDAYLVTVPSATESFRVILPTEAI
ncbi:MAG: hypothetical protein EHM48_00980 [Planctomycetaceae bacterium]|nr:MAG: hypothetical protein EHM48_00980 [Planctomycetaceae bacterium]